jgi:hypothetical protein
LQGPEEIPVTWLKTQVIVLIKRLWEGSAPYKTGVLKGTSPSPSPEVGTTLKTHKTVNIKEAQDHLNRTRIYGNRQSRKENKVEAVEFGKDIREWLGLGESGDPRR